MPPPVLARVSFLGHSIHRWVVPFAAVSIIATPVLFLGHALSDELEWLRYAFIANMAAVLFALIAAAFGAIDFRDIPKSHPARRTAWPHALLNVGALTLLVTNLVAYRDAGQAACNGALDSLARFDPTGSLVLTSAAALGTVTSALIGLTLAHRYKVGVVDHEPLRPPFRPAEPRRVR